jgi:hypothetical protein
LGDGFRPPGPLTPRQTFQFRFLIGANLLALLVAVISFWVAALTGERLTLWLLGGFAVAVTAQLLMLRSGVPLAVLVPAELTTLSLFLIACCLASPDLEPLQLQWLLLLPLAALVLTDPERRRAGGYPSRRPVLMMTVVAVMLGLGVIAVKQTGWSLGNDHRETGPIDAAINFVSFMAATGGLLFFYEHSMRKTVAELAALRRLLAVCAWCKLIRDDHGEWVELGCYLATHQQTDLTHGICPDCLQRSLGEV